MYLEYLTDASGNPSAVVVPMADWENLMTRMSYYENADKGEDETAYLLSSDTMKNRLLDAKKRLQKPARSWDDVKNALGI